MGGMGRLTHGWPARRNKNPMFSANKKN